MAFQARTKTTLALRAGNIALTPVGNPLNSFSLIHLITGYRQSLSVKRAIVHNHAVDFLLAEQSVFDYYPQLRGISERT